MNVSSIHNRKVELTSSLRAALHSHGFMDYAACDFIPLADKGLAHDHVRIVGTDILARIPKQSQMRLRATENLAYEACCYERAVATGATPVLAAVLHPTEDLPRGALLVEEVYGRVAAFPKDLPAVMHSIARLHSLPLPAAGERSPLLDPADPLQSIMSEIVFQLSHIGASGIDGLARDVIEKNVEKLRVSVAMLRRPPKRLVAFDTHPGNFVIRADGAAILVDLEKCRYSYPALDLAHTTLYTSTTWDVETYAVLSTEEILSAYTAWQLAVGQGKDPHLESYAPLRRAMWLWSLTWCIKWLAIFRNPRVKSGDGEDWSKANSDQNLIRHVYDRVDHYLSPSTIRQMASELDDLENIWNAQTEEKCVSSISIHRPDRK